MLLYRPIRPVIFVGVFDAPFELADEAIVKRLEDFCECQVLNTYCNCHQGTNIPNGFRTFSVILNRHLPASLRFGRFQVCLFHRYQPQRCHKCNLCVQFARECLNLVFLNCDNLGGISKECPDSPRCTAGSVEHVMRAVLSSTSAGRLLRVLK